MSCGAVDTADVIDVDGVEFENVVVEAFEGFEDGGTANEGGIAQHADFGIGEIFVTQGDDVVHYFWKLWMGCGFAVAGKSEYVGVWPVLLHEDQTCFEGGVHFFTGGQAMMGVVVLVVSALAVDAIEGAVLAVVGKQVDAQRYAETAAVDGAEDGGRIDYCRQFVCYELWITDL